MAKDCSTDVTGAFNAWLATVPDWSVINLAGGCYRSEGTIDVRNRHGLTFEGNGARIRATTTLPDYSNRAQLAFWLGSDHTVRNLTLQGVNMTADCAQPGGVGCFRGTREWDHNLRISGTQRVLVDHVSFRNAWGDAVAAAPGGQWDSQGNGAVLASDVTVQNSSIHTTGRMAFGCTGCRRFTVQDNVITNIGYHVVDVEVEAPAWHGDVTLLRNRYSNVYLALVSATTGEGDRGPIVVRGNVREDDPVACGGEVNVGYHAFETGDVEVVGNTFRSLLQGVAVEHAANVTVSGNTILAGGGGCGQNVGASVTYSSSATVTNNVITNAAQVALLVATPARVCGNVLDGRTNQPAAC